MKMNRYLKSVIGAIIGFALAGVWLAVDLLTPEPIGDFLLYFLMAVTNMAIGWQIGRSFGKSRDAGNINDQTKGERVEAKFELKS
ncbi:MAG TPA: hypothetical protein VGI04_03975 [Neobacillus sp.]|jgi:hypothetical protein